MNKGLLCYHWIMKSVLLWLDRDELKAFMTVLKRSEKIA